MKKVRITKTIIRNLFDWWSVNCNRTNDCRFIMFLLKNKFTFTFFLLVLLFRCNNNNWYYADIIAFSMVLNTQCKFGAIRGFFLRQIHNIMHEFKTRIARCRHVYPKTRISNACNFFSLYLHFISIEFESSKM